MASGWWKTTHENLGEMSPVDFEVTTDLEAPRGYPKLASIATGAGLFLGGTPCAVVDDVVYYAGDSYTQDTDAPTLNRWDGRVNTVVLEVPPVVSTNAKAILSIVGDRDENIYFSTWDSGTTSANFTGRVFKFNPSTGVTEVWGSDFYTAGRLPYALAVLGTKLYIGTTNQDPASNSIVRTVLLEVETDGAVPDNTTTCTYRVTVVNTDGEESGGTSATSVTNRATLSAEAYNAISWTAPAITAGFANYKLYRTAGHSSTGVIATQSGLTFTDDGDAGNAAAVPAAPTTATPTAGFANDLSGNGSFVNTYLATSVIGGVESYPVTFSTTSPAAGSTQINISVQTAAGADSVKLYRIFSTSGLALGFFNSGAPNTGGGTIYNIFDTLAAGDGTYPKIAPPTTAPTVTATNPKLLTGGVGCLVPYSGDLYAGMYYTAAGFATVQKITTAGVVTTSQTAAPGGSAANYNGYTAGVVFEGNLYMAYWIDAATNVTLIQKFNGSAWSTVHTISGAGARPIVGFSAGSGTLYAYGGGDALTGILLSSPDGTTWTDVSALLPSAKEAIPFMGTANVVGGF